MHNRSLWFMPFLIPIATLSACGPVADPAPFETSGSNSNPTTPAPSGAGRPGTAASSLSPATTSPASNATPSASAAAPSKENTAPVSLNAPAGGSGGAPSTPARPAPTPAPAPATPAAAAADPIDCASYDTGFLPLVHDPVCSGCHTSGSGLPLLEPFAQAQTRCALIGREVASGAMPPRGGLSADQRAIVASWVSLQCPETAAEAALLCAQSPAKPQGTTPAPAPAPSGAGNGGEDGDDGDDD